MKLSTSYTHCKSVLIKLFLTAFVICNIIIIYYIYSSRNQGIRRNVTPIIGDAKMKYVLLWWGKIPWPFNCLGEGNSAFIENDCKYKNCFITANASYLNLTDFNAIAFNGRNVIRMTPSQLPKRRSPKQKYIFVATESAARFPVCHKVLDNFFNWTWTYKLSSDFCFGYITIYDLEGNVVGPAIDMKWPQNMTSISEDLKVKLFNKSKTAAWFVSNCRTLSKREVFISKLRKESRKYGWDVDVYGSCGNLKCPISSWSDCAKKVQDEYFFYFAFENSFAEDYVTEKVFTALGNYAVPVVFGSANYSRLWAQIPVPIAISGSICIAVEYVLIPVVSNNYVDLMVLSSLQIQKLSGGDNYNTWKFAVKTYIEYEELWDCVNPEGTKEIDPQKYLRAKSKIILLIYPINSVHIQDASSSMEVWTTLQTAFKKIRAI